MNNLVIVRGGGDVATGTIQKLHRVGFDVLVLETPEPTCIRKTVAVAQAIYDGQTQVEDIIAVSCEDTNQIKRAFAERKVAVAVDPDGEYIKKLKPLAVVDGIIAKRNLGTHRDMAPITIGLGPGFTAGGDVDCVIETNRGHDLGRLIFHGKAHENTGNPGNINGYTTERILRAPATGKIEVIKDIGSVVKKDELVAKVDGVALHSSLDGMVRGMINNGLKVTEGMKVGDVDPRVVERNAYTLSDKARTIGGGVLEAILILKKEKNL